jgi:uncharacterized membrane protein
MAATIPLTQQTSSLGEGGPVILTGGTKKRRVDSVDFLRGIIMVVMMLDHTRDFVHYASSTFDAANVNKTWPLLFFTRWITHFCAPLFVLLAGTGAYFQEMRGKSKGELSRFLLTRGLWLVAVELIVLRPIIMFNFDYAGLFGFLQVIWAIGWSMVVLAAVIHLPMRAIVVLSLAVIALHNTLDGVRVTSWAGPGTPVPGFGATMWHILHVPGVVFLFGAGGPPSLALYPLIPWIAVMAAGYALGALYRRPEAERKKILYRLGAAITTGFIVLRWTNLYGDASKWSHQPRPVMTLVSFLSASKYPPSLLYLMMTIGPALIFLAFFDERRRGAISRVFITYGRVPFFFYIGQWTFAHTLALIAGRIAGHPTGYLFNNIAFGPPWEPGSGFGLGMTYFLWILGVALLYPLCKWYAGIKARRTDWWLSYL